MAVIILGLCMSKKVQCRCQGCTSSPNQNINCVTPVELNQINIHPVGR